MNTDKKPFNRALRELRKWAPGMSNDGRFGRASEIHSQTIKNVMTKDSLPEVLTMKRWVEACGSTLSEFFAQFENSEDEETTIPPEHKGLHVELEELLKAAGPWPEIARSAVAGAYQAFQNEKGGAEGRVDAKTRS